MDIKTFFALNEGQINEMAIGTAADKAWMGFFWSKLKEKYGGLDPSFRVSKGSVTAWPRNSSEVKKAEDMKTWFPEAKAKGIRPGNIEQAQVAAAQRTISGLNWPLRAKAAQESPGAFKDSWDVMLKVGFCSPEQHADAMKVHSGGTATPSMKSTISTKKADPWAGWGEPAAAPAAPEAPANAPTETEPEVEPALAARSEAPPEPEIQIPDGMTPEQVNAAIQAYLQSQSAPPAPPPPKRSRRK